MIPRKYWWAAGVAGARAIGAAGTALAFSPDSAPASVEQAAVGRVNTYSAPFTCGLMPQSNVPLDPTVPQQGFPPELPLKPANYATDVNVHNPGKGTIVLAKKAVLTGWVSSIPGATAGQTSAPEQVFANGQLHRLELPSDGAFQVDCSDIVNVLQPPGAPPTASFIKGFVVFETISTLDVQDVITSERVGATVISCLLSDGQVVTATGSPPACPAGNAAAGTAGTISIAASNSGTGLSTSVETINASP